MSELTLKEIKNFIADDSLFEYKQIQDLVRDYLTWSRKFKLISYIEKHPDSYFIPDYLEEEEADRVWTLCGVADNLGDGDNRIRAGFTTSAINVRGWILTKEPFTPGFQDVLLETTVRCKSCDIWGEPISSVDECSECQGGSLIFRIKPVAEDTHEPRE